MTVAEMTFPFTIQPSYDGDMVGGLDFTVLKGEEPKQEGQQVQSEVAKTEIVKTEPALPAKSEPLKIQQQSANTVYRVQVYALPGVIRDMKILRKIERFVPGLKLVEVKGDDGLYRYMSEPVLEIEKAQRMIYHLRRIGYLDSFIKTEN